MKNLKYLAIACLLIFSTSCKDDDDAAPIDVNTSDLIGSWNITSKTGDGEESVTLQGQTITTTFTTEAKDFDNAKLIFSENNLLTGEGSYTVVEKYTVLGQEDTEEYEESLDFLTDGKWSVDGNKLTLTFSESEEEGKTVFTITEFNENLIKIESNTTIEGEEFGIPFSGSEREFITLEK